MNKIGMIITTIYPVSGDTTPPSHTINYLTNIELHILSPEQLIEEPIDWEKRMEALEKIERRIQNLEDPRSHQNLQIQDFYSIFQVPQQEEHTDLEKIMEPMIQFQSDPFDMIEARLSRLENIRRNEETLSTQSLTIPNTSNHVDENQESGILKTLTKIQFHHKILNLTNINSLTNWQVLISMKLKLENEHDPDP